MPLRGTSCRPTRLVPLATAHLGGSWLKLPGMTKPFGELTARTQVDRLRRLVRSALPMWNLPDARITLLYHGYNTTFRVDAADGRRFALRVNTQPHKTIAHLRGEVTWLAHLSAQTELHVPTPQRTREEALFTVVPSRDHVGGLPMVLFSWLDGRNLGIHWSRTEARAVGVAMAILHQNAAHWTMPAGAAFSPFDDVLTDLPNRLGDHPALDARARSVLTTAYDRAQALQNEAFAADTVIALHADLHGENLKWHRGRLRVFDFDDAGLGVPALDLAICAYYLRDDAGAEEELKAGYSTVRSLPPVTDEQHEAMVAGRNLLIVSDLIDQTNARLRALRPSFVAASVERLQRWLDTGRWGRRVDEQPTVGQV